MAIGQSATLEDIMGIEAAGYIAITDGSEIHAAGYTRTGVQADAEHALGDSDFVIEEASTGLVDYWCRTRSTPTIVEVRGVNCLSSEADEADADEEEYEDEDDYDDREDRD